MTDSGKKSGNIEPIVGRYVHVELGGVMHRIYFEENGSGIPLVCLHTAGSDNRQWRHLLCDEELTRHYRIIAFDMPWHGKSNPPDETSAGEYQLTTASYTETVRAFCAALELQQGFSVDDYVTRFEAAILGRTLVDIASAA